MKSLQRQVDAGVSTRRTRARTRTLWNTVRPTLSVTMKDRPRRVCIFPTHTDLARRCSQAPEYTALMHIVIGRWYERGWVRAWWTRKIHRVGDGKQSAQGRAVGSKQLSLMVERNGLAVSVPKTMLTRAMCRRCKTEPCPQEVRAVDRLRHLRVMEKTICWRTKPSGQKRQSCGSWVTKSKTVSGRGHSCSSRRQSHMRTVRWRWMAKQTVSKCWVCGSERSQKDLNEDVLENQKDQWQQELVQNTRR